ncbi:hypothetical protein MYCTH_38365 [Thermothelomyces thermophilus ATCC 42464]|uniref:Vacuolar calcium ion transporter n=1 Tax=Thermothelomyces thermophilus (strain ATCC 42464 / BCRC 31852 / DSM 1799) TaxID=573729 RepID=G2Q5A3_THET4|nr:uncharacterized protein MYCTH_38365 [Thermothelomyces thermophilus ATCC 42464]AEO55443.1 hypothetical protein MYCTH_38365 [Thermothelomyces thermophilus ATCC 42464]
MLTPLPVHNGDVDLTRELTPAERIIRTFCVRASGESGRSGIHPMIFLRNVFRSASWASRIVNVLWPVVPAAIAVRYAMPDNHLVIFILSYLAMVPCANLIGYAGQELARKLPHVLGVVIETMLGGVVELIIFIVLIKRPATNDVNYIQVIQAAILGSVLATMLLCLGLCFVAAGLKRNETHFSEAVSEAGSALLWTAGFGLAIPTVFEHSLRGTIPQEELVDKAIEISRSTAVLLLVAYVIYVFFQVRTHHGIYDAVFVADEERHARKRPSPVHHRLTFTECSLALAVAIALVTLIAIALVDQIHYLVEGRHVSDAFVGLILVPLVEKAAEHLTAVNEAYANQMNFALSHVLGATLQTALFNAPLIVIVGWALDKPMGLNFEVFDVAVLLLAIIALGNFLRDQKTNYLEGSLCVLVYIAIAVAALYYPNPHLIAAAEAAAGSPATAGEGGASGSGGGGGHR